MVHSKWNHNISDCVNVLKIVFVTSWYHAELVSFYVLFSLFFGKIQVIDRFRGSYFIFFLLFCLAIKCYSSVVKIFVFSYISFFCTATTTHSLFNMSIEFDVFRMWKNKWNNIKTKRSRKKTLTKKVRNLCRSPKITV